MYIYLYIYMNICLPTYIHTHICIDVYMYINIYTYMYIYIHVLAYIHIYTHGKLPIMNTAAQPPTHTLTYTQTLTYTHTATYTGPGIPSGRHSAQDGSSFHPSLLRQSPSGTARTNKGLWPQHLDTPPSPLPPPTARQNAHQPQWKQRPQLTPLPSERSQ